MMTGEYHLGPFTMREAYAESGRSLPDDWEPLTEVNTCRVCDRLITADAPFVSVVLPAPEAGGSFIFPVHAQCLPSEPSPS